MATFSGGLWIEPRTAAPLTSNKWHKNKTGPFLLLPHLL
jgi:hypothetical protein